MPGGAYAYAIVAGDFNGDGNQDIAIAGNPNSLQVLLGNGKGGFHALPLQTIQGIPAQLFAADFNGDGHLDLAAITTGSGAIVQVYLGNGTGKFVFDQVTYFTAGYYSGVGGVQPGDLNNDGKIDFVSFSSGLISVLLNTTP